MAEEAKKPGRRTHVTTACTACRESKVKCDGERPKCGNCSKGRSKECVYQLGDDRRISLRKAIEVFSRRLSQLESALHVNFVEIPSMPPDDQTFINKMLDMADLEKHSPKSGDDSSSGQNLTTAPRDPGGLTQTTQEIREPNIFSAQANNPPETLASIYPQAFDLDMFLGQLQGEKLADNAVHPEMGAGMMDMDQAGFNFESPDWNFDYPELSTVPAGAAGTAGNGTDFFYSMPIYGTFPDSSLGPEISSLDDEPNHTSAISSTEEDPDHSTDEEKDEVIQKISNRLGSLQVADDGELRYFGATSNLNLLDNWQTDLSEAESLRTRGEANIEKAGLGQSVDHNVITRLANLYFAWQDPSFHVVDRTVFEEKRVLYDGGTDNSTFYSEALTNSMIWLEVELDSPRVATVQALVIMSSYEAAYTRDVRGWVYSGMAVRLALDLGLHTDMTPYIQRKQMTASSAKARRVAFWGCFIIDHMWGFYLGRPPVHLKTDEISTHKPADTSSDSIPSSWIPYDLSTSSEESAVPQGDGCVELVCRQWVELCEIMSGLSGTLFGCVDVSKHALQALAEKTVERLSKWHAELPLQLQVHLDDESKTHLPHVLILQMQYYQFMIYVHRPFVSKYSSQPYPPVGPGYNHARMTCVDSAVAISKLVSRYKNLYKLRLVNVQVVSIVFSAALILVFATLSEIGNHAHSDLNAHLSTCCQVLAELGKTFNNATRTLEVLLSIKQAWQAKLVASVSMKRRGSRMGRADSNTMKRSRP